MHADQAGLPRRATTLTEQFKGGLAAPICLTWELTYACNLQCVHCLSASGRRDPRELSTAECMRVVCLPDRPRAGPGHSRRPAGRSAPVFVPVDLIAVRAAT